MATETGVRTDRIGQTMDHLWRIGQQDKGTKHDASDGALWAIARAYDRDAFPGQCELISRDVDEVLLAEMRMSYESGRDPESLLATV